MSFNTTIFSDDGLNLLSQISSTKSLRIKNIYVDNIEHSASDFNEIVSWWVSATEFIMPKFNIELAAASVISDQARLIVKLALSELATETIPVKTIVITACGVENGIESSEVVLCGISDSVGVEILYDTSAIKLSTSVAIYFAFNNTSEITFATGINPDYVIHSELDRFVSCHPVGDTTGGEAQTIGGIKTFNDGITINTLRGSKLSFYEYDTTYTSEVGWIGSTDSSGLQIMSMNTSNLEPVLQIGDTSNNKLFTISRDADGNSLITADGTLTTDSFNATTIKSTSVETNTLKIDKTTVSSTNGGLFINGTFAPTDDNRYSLGSLIKRWYVIYGNEIRSTGGFHINSPNAYNDFSLYEDGGNINLDGFTSGHGLYLGQMRNPASGAYEDRAPLHCGDVHALDINAEGDLNVAGSINGVIPVPAGESDILVGCIVVLKSSIETKRGDSFSINTAGTSWMNRRTNTDIILTFSDLEPETVNRTLNLSDFTQNTRFVALSHGDANKPFLAIRTV